MKKLFGILFLVPFLMVVLLNLGSSANRQNKDVFTCLLVGFDDAAENTDVISVLSYSISRKSMSLVQIPRDSYCFFDGDAGKINRIYPKSRAMGHKRNPSMELLLGKTEALLGIKLDGYAGLSVSAFTKLVDKIGGVYIDVPETFPTDAFEGKIKHGENLIDGETAKLFVRHRASYSGGDLSRLDAQKIFFEGLFKTFFEKLNIKTLISLLTVRDDGVVADIPTLALTRLLLSHSSEIKDAELNVLTLPGSAVMDNGISYYVVNKSAASDAASKFLFTSAENFDKNAEFSNKDNPVISKAYNENVGTYRVYKNGKIIDVKINAKG